MLRENPIMRFTIDCMQEERDSAPIMRVKQFNYSEPDIASLFWLFQCFFFLWTTLCNTIHGDAMSILWVGEVMTLSRFMFCKLLLFFRRLNKVSLKGPSVSDHQVHQSCRFYLIQNKANIDSIISSHTF